jgi:hypothetical protein
MEVYADVLVSAAVLDRRALLPCFIAVLYPPRFIAAAIYCCGDFVQQLTKVGMVGREWTTSCHDIYSKLNEAGRQQAHPSRYPGGPG